MTDDQFEEAKRLYTEQGWSMLRVARELGLCRVDLTKRMKAAGVRARSRSEAAKLRQQREKQEQAEAPEAEIDAAEAAWRKALAGQRYEDDPRAPVPRNHVRMDAPRLEWRAL